jgi:protein involved in polysaccharide export with SLBB domain
MPNRDRVENMSNNITKFIRLAAILLAATLSFAPCPAMAQDIGLPGPSQQVRPAPSATDPSALPKYTAPVPVAPGEGITDEHYRLGISDKLKITVYGEDDLSGEFVVDSTGQIQLPLVGQVKAANLTLHEFKAEVVAALSDGYLKDPKVSVEVLNYRPFYIMGEVNKPGEYPYENGLTVLSAIALAGGYTYRANDDKVYVRHNGESQEHTMPADSKTKILPGDIVRVPERIF